MNSNTYPQRRKPGPPPSNEPKSTTTPVALYPVDRAALEWWKQTHGTKGRSDALRQMIDKAMSLSLGAEWADRIEEAS